MTLRLGFSPCPNDTFMFDALVHERVPSMVDSTLTVWMADIEELNRRAAGNDPLEVTKLSVPALARNLDRYAILSAGAALGRGVGPLVVRRPGGADTLSALSGARVAIPGRATTAYLLLQSFADAPFDAVEMRFDEIMPAVVAGEVEAGLVIHESRFTYRDLGLECVADLGEVWEADTGLPLPLGVIGVRRSLGVPVARALADGLALSVQYAFDNPSASAEYVHKHAQEMDPEVCRQHIDLYVTDFSIGLGPEGSRAIEEMVRRGRDAGLLPHSEHPLFVG